MKVKCKETQAVVEATKINDTTYSVNGKEIGREDMAKLYTMVKDKPEKKKEDTMIPTMIENTMSDNIDLLAKALVKANGQMTNGTKNKDGYNYQYLTLDKLADMIRPVLAKNGLAIVQTHSTKDILVGTTTMLLHESGQWMKTTLDIPLAQSKQLSLPQQVGVICTYSRRYALQSFFMIVAEDDNDGVVK